MNALRIAFFGTPEFSIPCLKSLIESRHQVVLVATRPDKPKGRGNQVSCSPVKELALRHGMTVLQPIKAKEPGFIEALRAANLDLITVAAYGLILPKTILDIPKMGCVNVHASLLPKYRGAAPINWAIVRGETVTGITTMLMDPGMDTGDMLLKDETPIFPDDTAESLHDRLAPIGAHLLMGTIDGLQAGTIAPEKQNNDLATYAPMLKKEHGLIGWEKSAKDIDLHVRGMFPWPGAYTFLNGQMIKIHRVGNIIDKAVPNQSGEIISIEKEGIRVATGAGSLLIQDLQLENRRRMSADEFLRGHCAKIGERFGAIISQQQDAKR